MLEDNPVMDLNIPSRDATEISTSLMDRYLAKLCISILILTINFHLASILRFCSDTLQNKKDFQTTN